jgi:hypothetical protein
VSAHRRRASIPAERDRPLKTFRKGPAALAAFQVLLQCAPLGGRQVSFDALSHPREQVAAIAAVLVR